MDMVRTFIIITITLLLCIALLICSVQKEVKDYSFWKRRNWVRITLPIKPREKEECEFSEMTEVTMPKWVLEQIKMLKDIMTSYFKEVYNIDISEKLEKQDLSLFEHINANSNVDETIEYTEDEEPISVYIKLGRNLFQSDVSFDNTFVHETLHQLGFVSINGQIITEGIVEALTDSILKYASITSVPRGLYHDIRILGYQILSVDTEIASFYLENEDSDITARITERLKDIEYPFEKVDAGERLEVLEDAMVNGWSSISPLYLSFEAQEIVRAYCQSFNPDGVTIDYIRNLYLIENYEDIEIEADGNDGYCFWNM